MADEMEIEGKTKSSILLGGDDAAMEEDEVDYDAESVDEPHVAATSAPVEDDAEAARLISRILAPSPFAHHESGPTSARVRNALSRVASFPNTDTEAWQALLAEASSCYRSLLPNLHSSSEARKLDWIESCYGALLQHFPYASAHYVTVLEMLLAQSALPGEQEGGILLDGANSMVSVAREQRRRRCELKVERIFRTTLGVEMDGTPALDNGTGITAPQPESPEEVEETEESANKEDENILGGICASSVDLWLLYVRKRTRDTVRSAQMQGLDSEKRGELVRECTMEAYETATSRAAFVNNNHLLWKSYLAFVKSWVDEDSIKANALSVDPRQQQLDHLLVQQQMIQLRSVYQRLVTHPILGLDQLWEEYEQFERKQSETLALALVAEYMPKKKNARLVYLERGRVYNIHELRMGRLATPPPVPPSSLLPSMLSPTTADSTVGATVGGTIGAGVGAVGGAAAVVAGAGDTAISSVDREDSVEDYQMKVAEDYQLLTKWKRRTGYERTNPEGLSGPDLSTRIRQAYKDAVCTMTCHPEVWHEWSMWELYRHHSQAAQQQQQHHHHSQPSAGVASRPSRTNAANALLVLELAQKHIPDCTIVAYSRSQIVEQYMDKPADCIAVMDHFVSCSPNTLGFVLLQRLVRKYKGINSARKVFGRARRILRVRDEDVTEGILAATTVDDAAGVENDTGADGAATTVIPTVDGVRSMVMNRVGPASSSSASSVPRKSARPSDTLASPLTTTATLVSQPGIITWHLFAAHATMEHRLNSSPEVAARVYELGLRKHRTFLATPQYVIQYAHLLLELGDTENLRALLVRAIAACEEASSDVEQDATATKRDTMKPLWDMMLRLELILPSTVDEGASEIDAAEARRRKALFGPTIEDVSTGGFIGMGNDGVDEVGIGGQKLSLAEQLIRVEGYDVSSRIVNGMSRLVDIMEVMGVWGNSSKTILPPMPATMSVWEDELAGSTSDACYQGLLRYKRDLTMGSRKSVIGAGQGTVAGADQKIMSARERYQQQHQQMVLPGALAALQNSPEWLRGLLTLLPPPPRNRALSKPPPHLIEMTLMSLRSSVLPAERPSDNGAANGVGPMSLQKRKMNSMNSGGDSSDEEDGMTGASGYGGQFRARQRARMSSFAQQQNGTAGEGDHM